MSNNNLATKLVHAGRKSRYTQGSVNSVIQRASSLVFDTVADKKKRHVIAIKAHYSMAGVAL